MKVRVITREGMSSLKLRAMRHHLEFPLTIDEIDALPAGKLIPVARHWLHNDHTIRCRVQLTDKLGDCCEIDLLVADFNALPTFDVPDRPEYKDEDKS